MTYLKRTAAAVLGGAILCTTSAFAAEPVKPQTETKPAVVQTAPDTAPKTEAMPEVIAERDLFYGKIAEILKEGDKVTGLLMESEKDGEYIFHIGERTLFLNSGEGTMTGLESLKVGDSVYVYHSPAMTMSLPPQSAAEAIVTNVPADARAAMLHTVERVAKNEDGSVVVTTDGGQLQVTIAKDAVYGDYMGRQIMGADDLRIGTRFFTWYQAVQESLPAKVGVNKLTVAPANDLTDLGVSIDEKVLENVTAKMENGTLMIPAGAVAKEFGLKASYQKLEKGEQVTLKGADQELVMDVGSDSFKMKEDAVTSYGAAVVITEGTTWMPAQALADLVGAELSLHNGTVVFTPVKK